MTTDKIIMVAKLAAEHCYHNMQGNFDIIHRD